MNEMKFIGLGCIFFMLFVSSFMWLPRLIRMRTVAEGEVTSVSVQYQLFITTTSVNFRDGTNLQLWGEHNISPGYRKVVAVSSWMLIYDLESWE